ncbi:MAG: ATP-binding protein [Tannerellaceae bacterium]|jgi:hypothetical protein|nr:ATP-binding protein [Tannerellaceae bacterium]
MKVTLELTAEFRNRVALSLIAAGEGFEGTDIQFARKYGINKAVYSRIKGGDLERVLSPQKWLAIGRALDVSPDERKWNKADTDVFKVIREEILFCKEFHKSMIFVDDCAIGKTYTARYLSRTVKNCFYVDCSQAKTRILFSKALARALGVDSAGTYSETKENIKYYLNMLTDPPLVILDEAGDVDRKTFQDLKELWNATDGRCGWYMMGADGLQRKIQEGIHNRTVAFRELFSRFSDKFSFAVPKDREEKKAFYRKLITDVLRANMTDGAKMQEIVNRCMQVDMAAGESTGLRRAESLLIMYS